MDKNKTWKYFKYAIGEIVLVVIGILIALYLNNQNQISKSNVKIDKLMEEVLLDLERNINQTNNLLRFYSDKDSLYSLVLNDQVTYDDYATNKTGQELKALTTWYAVSRMQQSAYDNLLGEQNSIPEKYTSIIRDLKKLNVSDKKFLDKYSDIVENMSNQNIQKRADNYEWYSNSKLDNPDRIEFMLKDYRYKNEVKHYSTITAFYVAFISDYNFLARRCYKEIAVLLNKPIDKQLNNYPEVAKSLVGSWQTEQAPGAIIRIYIKDERLLYSNNFDTISGHITILSNTKYVIENIFCTIVQEGDDIVVKTNDGSVWRKAEE